MKIEISGVDLTTYYAQKTLSIEDAINERSTANFKMIDESGQLDLKDGQPIEIYDNDNTLIFGGFLFFPKRFVPIATTAVIYDIEAVDNHAISDRFIVAETYTNESTGDIVKDLQEKYLADDGIWHNPSALEFDGVDDYVDCGNDSLLKPSTSVTIEAWIKPDTYSSNALYFIASKGTTGGKGYWIGLKSTGKAIFSVESQLSGDAVLSLNEWIHITGVWDGSEQRLYVNGVLDGTVATTISTIDYSGVPTFRIGDQSGSTGRYFDGEIDDVRVWNVSRTQKQIQDNMNKELVGNETGLVGYWKFNEESGTTATDSTSNSNDGTISGATYVTDTWSEQSIQDGANVEAITFTRIGTVSDAIDELAELSGFSWWVSHNKQLYFVQRNTFSAPFGLTDTAPINSVNLREDKSRYRNTQYIRGGLDRTQEIVKEKPTPSPDGVSKTFVVRFPIATKPRIFIDSVEVSSADIGVNGFDTNKKYYFTFNTNNITQDDTETVLSTETLEVTYIGLYPLLVVAQDNQAINDRKAIEGGTGIYENITNEPKINQRENALDIANGKLRKYTKIEREITYQTFESGLKTGQLQNVNMDKYKVENAEFLIDRMTITDFDGTGMMLYDVHCVDGEVFGGWTQFFKQLAKEPGKLIIREDEVLVILESSFETQGWAEDTEINVFACPVPSETLYPSETLHPC